MKKWKFAGLVLCMAFSLSACGNGGNGTDYTLGASEYGISLSEEETEISYEVPVMTPNILVDMLGYEPEGDKTVIFRGEALPETFALCDEESGETVYTGSIEKKESAGSRAQADGYGDFSDFTTPGNYYIQTDVYGESYPFIIHDNLYYFIFQQACRQLHAMRSGEEDGGADSEISGWNLREKGEDGEISACICIYQLLCSYELFPEVYTDDTGIPESGNEIPDILDECRYEARWLIYQAQVNPDSSSAACGYRAATLAKYAYMTKGMDAAFAGECQREAENAWKSVEKDQNVQGDLLALAAAELYRLTGGRQYQSAAEEYLSVCADKTSWLSDLEFLGGVAYMNTKSQVDVDLCSALIKKIMEEAENIAAVSRQDSFLVCTGGSTTDTGELLQEMLRICVVNHVITNHEYNNVIENHFHYLMGRNPESLCYVSYWDGQEPQTEGILEDPVQNSAFIFMLSELLSNQ